MKPFYTHREELWNSWSHAAGILLGMAFGMVFLYWCFRVKDGWATFGVSLYLLGMVGSYVASTSYHALRPASPWKERLRKWDHAAIYWHIAGSYSRWWRSVAKGLGGGCSLPSYGRVPSVARSVRYAS